MHARDLDMAYSLIADTAQQYWSQGKRRNGAKKGRENAESDELGHVRRDVHVKRADGCAKQRDV